MEMMTNCLSLVPVHVPTARDTITAVSRLLGRDGVYVNYDAPSTSAGKTRGKVIEEVVAQVSATLVDAQGTNREALPLKSDWMHVHAPLVEGLRSIQDPGLAYAPPTFYQELSYYLPWSLRVAPSSAWVALGCVKKDLLACGEIYIKGINAAVQNHQSKGRPLYAELCSCVTCSCGPTNLPAGTGPETFVGWQITSIDVDGSGSRPAMQVSS